VYNGYYINSVDSSNYHTARGFNYHQGPVSLHPFLPPALPYRGKARCSASNGGTAKLDVALVMVALLCSENELA